MKLITEEINNVQFIVEADANGVKNHFIEGTFMMAETKNRNGRVYPMAVLNKEATRYNNEYIAKNRAFGELGHPDCFHDKTEILTVNDGWKPIKDVVIGELIYTMNDEIKAVEIHPVTATYNELYVGELVSLRGRGINTKVTPNHRFLVENSYSKKLSYLTAEEIFLCDDLSKSFIPKAHDFNLNDSGSEEEITIGSYSISRKVFFAFMGLYLSEGCTVHRKGRKQSFVVQIVQNVGDKADLIDMVLCQMPMVFSKNVTGKKTIWKTSDYDLAAYLSVLGKAHEKYLPQDLITSMSSSDALIFIENYLIGDGRGKIGTKYVRADVFSVSEEMIDDICHIAFIAGIATKKFSVLPDKDYEFAGRTIKAENKRPLHFCRFLTTKGVFLDKRFLKVEKEQFEGTVHCVTVENGNFYARDDGYTFWTGNSPTINLDRVSHMITSLKSEGNNFIGKAKILDTPNGRIVKSLLDGGASLGVSTRGVGSLKPANGYQLVQDDFHLATAADIVADPSAPDAFVRGIMENYDFYIDNVTGEYRRRQVEAARNTLRSVSRHEVEEVAIKLFEDFMSKM